MARLQLDLSDTNVKLLDKLMVLCDLKTKKDVVENGLMLLGWAAEQSSKGLAIAAVDEDRKIYREVTTPALEGARASADRELVQAHKLKDEAYA